jgi:capsular polysaccharide biosynthesis protein
LGVITLRVASLAVAASLLFAAVAWAVSAWQNPTYEASAQVWVNFRKLDDRRVQPGGSEGAQSLVQSTAFAIDTSYVAKRAVRRLDLGMSPGELLRNTTVEQVDGTNLIRLAYEGTNPQVAARIADTLAEVASERTIEVSPRNGGSGLTPVVYEKASLPEDPVSPKPVRNGLIALLATLVLSVGLIAGREYWRR